MSSLQTTNYVMPYQQPLLGGKNGLTSQDIAKVVGWTVGKVNERLNSKNYADLLRRGGCELNGFPFKSHKRGRPGKMWVLDVAAAKIFIAQTNNLLGIGYVVYLLACEKIVEEQVPLLQSTVKKMQCQLDVLMKPKVVKTAEGRMLKIIKGIKHVVNLFGEEADEVIVEYKKLTEMDNEELRAHHFQHLIRISHGISKAVKEIGLYERTPARPNALPAPTPLYKLRSDTDKDKGDHNHEH